MLNNTKRSINFVIAFMTVISLLTFVFPNIDFESFGENIEIVFPNMLFFLFVIVFSFIQFIFRILITSKYYIKDKIFFSLDMKPPKLYNRMISYLIAFTLFLWPVIVSRNFSVLKLSYAFNLIIWILIIEILLYISNKYTNLYFMTDGILVRGLDFRIDIPLNDGILNHSGFYSYHDFQSYSIKKNGLKLVLFNELGIIEGYISNERIKPVSAFFESKGIRNRNSGH